MAKKNTEHFSRLAALIRRIAGGDFSLLSHHFRARVLYSDGAVWRATAPPVGKNAGYFVINKVTDLSPKLTTLIVI